MGRGVRALEACAEAGAAATQVEDGKESNNQQHRAGNNAIGPIKIGPEIGPIKIGPKIGPEIGPEIEIGPKIRPGPWGRGRGWGPSLVKATSQRNLHPEKMTCPGPNLGHFC